MNNYCKNFVWILYILLALITIISCTMESKETALPPSELVGKWVGKGTHNLPTNILPEKKLDIKINISEDGSVTGSIGDADIVKTELKELVGLGARFKPKTWKCKFDFNGNILNKINFHRNGGILLFQHPTGETVTCSFESYGNDSIERSRILRIEKVLLKRPSPEDDE